MKWWLGRGQWYCHSGQRIIHDMAGWNQRCHEVLSVGCDQIDADEVHSVGEGWCVTLWEARRNRIAHHGPIGNQIMLQLVTEGMNLCPLNPTFIQARDAFFEAVLLNNYCVSDWGELWEAFSKRGMGWGASAPDSSDTVGVVESFAGGSVSPWQD